MSQQNEENSMVEKAIEVLVKASSEHGIKASSEETDNYNRIWSRDTAVTALAIIANQNFALYKSLKSAIINLQKATAVNGQIPSNIAIDENGAIKEVSFGGPVGRTDSSFWWVIMTLQLLQQEPDDELKAEVYKQSKDIFKLAEAWEFNGKNLMYLPMSGNWADEYVTHGYVLYDQILRYWALDLAGSIFNHEEWKEKASTIKTAIKQHYLFEADLSSSLYTKAQQKELINFDLEHQFIASFSPGDRVESFDCWSVGLLLLLNIPSKETANKLEIAVKNIFSATNKKGIPAFYPLIKEGDNLYPFIKLNYSYNFKNQPGHFHNGGIWPVVNGFLIAGLSKNGFIKTANVLQKALHRNLFDHQDLFPFAEYFDFYESQPLGVKNLCYSAAGYLIGHKATSAPEDFKNRLFNNQVKEELFNDAIELQVREIIKNLALKSDQKLTITIAGESGCGKTTLSRAIRKKLEKAGKKIVILHQDDYFKLPPKQNHQARLNNFNHIGVEEVRLDLIDNHISEIKGAEIHTLKVPHMDWLTNVEESRLINVTAVDIIIVDGTYTSLLSNVDYRIFINTNYQNTQKNRAGRKREEQSDFIEKVLEKESTIISAHKELANLVLNNEFNIVP